MSDLLNNPVSFHDIEYQFATSGVYAIHCKYTDTYYIGQGVVVLRRLVDHFAHLRGGSHPNALLQKEFTEVGEPHFVIGLIAEMPNAAQHELLRRETQEIQRFKAHGKKLYNKVSDTIKLAPVEPPDPEPIELPSRPYTPGSISRSHEKYRSSHAERVDPAKQAPATCYECGLSGMSQVDIFVCDDGFHRCQPCVEVYLDQWRLEFTPATRRKPLPAPAPVVRRGSYRRWLVPENASVQEHIILAVDKFSRQFGYMPTRVFVHPDLYKPHHYRDIEVIHGGIAVGRYIDIPID